MKLRPFLILDSIDVGGRFTLQPPYIWEKLSGNQWIGGCVGQSHVGHAGNRIPVVQLVEMSRYCQN
jgi:hypothetical protein